MVTGDQAAAGGAGARRGHEPPAVIPAPPGTPANDRTLPLVALLSPGRQRLRTLLAAQGVPFRIQVDEPVTVVATLRGRLTSARRRSGVPAGRGKERRLAQRTYRFDRPGTYTLRLKPNAALRVLLRRERRLPAVLLVRAEDGAGNARTRRKRSTSRSGRGGPFRGRSAILKGPTLRGSGARRPARSISIGPMPASSLGRRRPRPVADAPALDSAELAKAWLVELVAVAPLEQATRLPGPRFAEDAPRLCAAVVAALAGDGGFEDLEPGGALAPWPPARPTWPRRAPRSTPSRRSRRCVGDLGCAALRARRARAGTGRRAGRPARRGRGRPDCRVSRGAAPRRGPARRPRPPRRGPAGATAPADDSAEPPPEPDWRCGRRRRPRRGAAPEPSPPEREAHPPSPPERELRDLAATLRDAATAPDPLARLRELATPPTTRSPRRPSGCAARRRHRSRTPPTSTPPASPRGRRRSSAGRRATATTACPSRSCASRSPTSTGSPPSRTTTSPRALDAAEVAVCAQLRPADALVRERTRALLADRARHRRAEAARSPTGSPAVAERPRTADSPLQARSASRAARPTPRTRPPLEGRPRRASSPPAPRASASHGRSLTPAFRGAACRAAARRPAAGSRSGRWP
jgi:hypothetical protein